MKLATITVAFPLFRLKSRVVHFTPRRPIVFEQALLGIVRRFGRNPRWSGLLVLDVFQEVLLVTDAEKLVLPYLDELVSLEVLAYSGDRGALASARLADLSLTDRGMQMLTDGMLPGKRVESLVSHVYDPVKNILIKDARAGLYLKAPLPASVGHELVCNTYPRPLIEERLHQEAHDWLNQNSQILDVRPQSREVLWKAIPVELMVLPEGELHLSTHDPAYVTVLQGLDPDFIINHLVLPGLNGSARTNGNYDLPEQDFSHIFTAGADLFALDHLRDRMRLAHRGVFFVSYDLQAQSKAIVAAIKGLKSGLVVVHGTPESHEGPWFQWISRNVALMHTHDPYPLPGCLCFGSDGSNWFAASFSFSVGNLKCRIPWGYVLKKEAVLPAAKACLDRIQERVIAGRQLEAIAMMVFWMPVERVWECAWGAINPREFQPAEVLRRMLEFRAIITRTSGAEKLPSWSQEAVSFLVAMLRDDNEMPLASLADQIVQALTHCGPLTRDQADILLDAFDHKFQATTPDEIGSIKAKVFSAITSLSQGNPARKSGNTSSPTTMPGTRIERHAKVQKSPQNPADRSRRTSELPASYR